MQRPVGGLGTKEADEIFIRGIRRDPAALRGRIVEKCDREQRAQQEQDDRYRPVGTMSYARKGAFRI